jgi:hypothetical protein
MAWVLSEVASITYTVTDDDRAVSKMQFWATLPTLNQWSQDAAEATIDQLWSLIAPLIDAVQVGVAFNLSGYEDTFPEPVAESDVEDKGVFLARTTNNKPVSVALASILESKLVTDGLAAGIQIDVADADVAAFIDALEDGIDLNPLGILDTVRFGTDRGESIATVIDAYKQNRSSQKSRGRRG